jgi:NMD protein affecting ribosome stability and mRNA decay
LKVSQGVKIVDKVLCYSCNKSKNELSVKKSLLLPINLLLCQSCSDSKFEPRWTIILAGRQNGSDYVKEFIIKRKYVGVEISASELLV